MSTSTATAYEYNVAGHLSFGAPKCEKAQKSSGFWANRTYRLCIKDNVLIDCAEGSGGLMATLFRAIGLRRYNSLDRFPKLRRASGLRRYGISRLAYNKVRSRPVPIDGRSPRPQELKIYKIVDKFPMTDAII